MSTTPVFPLFSPIYFFHFGYLIKHKNLHVGLDKETRGTNWILHIKQGPLSLFSLYTVDSNISYKETIGM